MLSHPLLLSQASCWQGYVSDQPHELLVVGSHNLEMLSEEEEKKRVIENREIVMQKPQLLTSHPPLPGCTSELAAELTMAVPVEMEVEEDFEEQDDIVNLPLDLLNLLHAAEDGDADSLRQALDELNGSVNEAGEDGDTALHLACLYGNLSCVQILVNSGASIYVKDEDGAIPLHDACAGGYLEIVKVLLEAAENEEKLQSMLETVDVDGDTPLHHAARGDHAHVVRELLSHGASPNVKNLQGKTPGEVADEYEGTAVQSILDAAVHGC